MVWIQGGMFELSSTAAYDGSRFARDGVVCVVINWRPGAEGFLYLDDGIADVGCSLKAYRTRFVKRLPPFHGMHRFLPALARMEGARITELPVAHRARRFGKSKYNISNRLWRGIADLLGVWWLRRRWVAVAAVEEISAWQSTSTASGPSSASPAKPSSSAASSSSGSPPSAPSGA
jgi:hypothetical protein